MPLFPSYTLAGKFLKSIGALVHSVVIQGNAIGNVVKEFEEAQDFEDVEKILESALSLIVPGNLVSAIVPFTIDLINKLLGVETEGKTQKEILVAAAAKIKSLPALIKKGIMTLFSALHSVKVAELQGTVLPLQDALVATPTVYDFDKQLSDTTPNTAGTVYPGKL